jgi:cytoskeletal protein CcmA (bactofilin family)
VRGGLHTWRQKQSLAPPSSSTGEVSSGEDISIRGTVKGKVKTTADLFIEEGGIIEAEVETRSIDIEGTVIGNVRASDRYELKPAGRVTGDVFAPRVVIADGSRFKGSIDMGESGPPLEREGAKAGGKAAKR